MKSKTLKILILLFCVMSFFVGYNEILAYEISSGNKGGLSQGGISSLNKSKTIWPSVGEIEIRAVRVRIFRGGKQRKSRYFIVTNDSARCYSSIEAKVAKTSGYKYDNVSSDSEVTITGVGTINLGCVVDSRLSDIFSDGTKLDSFLKNNDYSALREVLSYMEYTGSAVQDDDIVIVEPATLVKCAGTPYFGTSTALMKANVSYRGTSGNKCSAADNSAYEGYTFQRVFSNMSQALKVKSGSCLNSNGKINNSKYTGCGYFQYNIKDFYRKITIVYHSNGATTKKFKGTIISSDSKINKQIINKGEDVGSGLYNVQNRDYLYLLKTGYNSTGNWLLNSATSTTKLNQNKKIYWVGNKAFIDGVEIADVTKGNKVVDVYAEWEKKLSGPQLTIRKVKDSESGPLITSQYTYFELHQNADCSDPNYREIPVLGSENINLKANQVYSIKEKYAPDGYDLDDTCITIAAMSDGEEKTVTVVNNTACGARLDDLGENPTIEELIDLYNYELSQGNNYTNLLKTNNPSCSTAGCYMSSDLGCLTGNVGYRYFDENNLQCHEETITKSDVGITDPKEMNKVIGFCASRFSLTNKIPNNIGGGYSTSYATNKIYSTSYATNGLSSQGFVFYSKAGQFLLKQKSYSDNIYIYNNQTNTYQSIGSKYLATGKTTKVCYLLPGTSFAFKNNSENDIKSTIKINYKLFFGDNNGDDVTDSLEYDQENYFRNDLDTDNNLRKYEFDYIYNYKLKPVYLEKMSGKYSDQKTSQTSETPIYGVLSNFNGGEGNIKYGISYQVRDSDGKLKEVDNMKFDLNGDYGFKASNACNYRVYPEIVKYNKKDIGQLELEFRIVDSSQPFNRLTNSNWCASTSCSKTNSTINKYIKGRNNSYNKTGAGALYTNQNDGTKKIVLTPELIQKIRSYNLNVAYDDYSTYTDENGNITTNFLTEMGITKVN